jgi:hypothetical protein
MLLNNVIIILVSKNKYTGRHLMAMKAANKDKF